MKFTQGRQEESMPHQTKPNAKDKIKEGQAQIGNFAAKTAARPEVQAVGEAVNKAKKKFLGMLTSSKSEPQPQQPQYQGGKRRRKSRRKKRTKRRRKSRRKKRRTKRRRKSRRKRRR